MIQKNPILKEVEVRRDEALVDFRFDNGASFSLSFEYLRVYSPSAEEAILQTGKRRVGVERIEATGNYAITIHFDDGHNTGIYTWDWLYELGSRHDELWAEYLKKMRDAGESRNPPTSSVLKILN